jgi:ADP-ribose pyrophosphatase
MKPRTKQRRVVYRGRVFRVEQDLVTMPNGRDVTMDVVRHRGSVVLVPQPSPGTVILIRQYRHVIGRWIWELPAGTLEPGEAPTRAARRECEEEIGWTPKRLRRLGTFYPTPGFCDERMIYFHCSELVRPRTTVAIDPDEQITPRTFTLKDVWALAAKGRIVDTKTILGLVLLGDSRRRPVLSKTRRRTITSA